MGLFMKFISTLVLSALVLVGCGGGGGGGDSSASTSSGLADPNSAFSQDYDVRQLRLTGLFSNHNLSGSSVVVALTYENDATRAIFLSGSDEIIVLVDGVAVVGSVASPGLLRFDVTDFASSYEVIWSRDGEVVAQSTANQLPREVDITAINDYAGTINYSWIENADTNYFFVGAALSCDDQYGQTTYFFYTPNDYNYEKNQVHGGSMSLSLADFGGSLADLQSMYVKCDVSFDLFAEDYSVVVSDLNNLSDVQPLGAATDYTNLF